MALVFPITRLPVTPYGVNPEKNIIESKTEDGIILSRPQYTSGRTIYNFKWEYITTADHDNLDAFWNGDCAYGSMPFTFSYYIENADLYGTGIVRTKKTINVRFTEPPKYTYVGGGLWTLECNFRSE